MNELKLNLLKEGIKLKMDKGQSLDDIMISYTKLTEEEKQEIRTSLNL